MRKNLGIRRRLAPLLGGDRRRIELLHALLLSLPGSPTLYYGDEIAMGDDYLLEDRDGVRTPMQWDASPAAGFSAAAPEDLYLPVVSDSGYSPADTNVEKQRGDPASLLNWLRTMLHLRKRHPVLGTGSFHHAPASDPAVFSFERGTGSERLLVVANVSDHPVVASVAADGSWVDLIAPGAPETADRFELEPFEFHWLAAVT